MQRREFITLLGAGGVTWPPQRGSEVHAIGGLQQLEAIFKVLRRATGR
jgi:hypothetical protein